MDFFLHIVLIIDIIIIDEVNINIRSNRIPIMPVTLYIQIISGRVLQCPCVDFLLHIILIIVDIVDIDIRSMGYQ